MGEKIFIAVCEDRHTDPVIRVFTDEAKAISYAKEFVEQNARHPEDIEEEKTSWIYACRYSEEGDYVHVEEGFIDDDSMDNA